MNDYLSVDATVVPPGMVTGVAAVTRDLTPALDRCGSVTTVSAERCVLSAVLGNSRFRIRPAEDVLDSTLAGALARRSGNCAALVAVVLVLTENRGRPFQAVILRDHVLLESSRHPGIYYETLLGGGPVDSDRLGLDMQTIRTDASGYLPYYVDNLAARAALSGDSETARTLFRRALALAPDSARIHYNVGTFEELAGNHELAARHLERAAEMGWPSSTEATRDLSTLDQLAHGESTLLPQ